MKKSTHQASSHASSGHLSLFGPTGSSLFGPARNYLTLETALGVLLSATALVLYGREIVTGSFGYFVLLAAGVASACLVLFGAMRRESH